MADYEILREVCRFEDEETPPVCTVRAKEYNSWLSYLDALWEVAKKDFPTLERDTVYVVKFAKGFDAGTHGIRFPAPAEVPKTYRETQEIEKVY